MISRLTPKGLALAAGLLAIPTLGARADEPSANALSLAAQVIADVGLKASVDNEVPTLAGEIQKQLAQMHPEMRRVLHEVARAIGCRNSRRPTRACSPISPMCWPRR